jgi:hypothetical protein
LAEPFRRIVGETSPYTNYLVAQPPQSASTSTPSHQQREWANRYNIAPLVPYLTAGVLACVAGALNPLGPLLILISAAAASFGGNSGLAWMWNLLYGPRIPSSEFQMPEIERSRGWIIAAVILAIGFIMGLGPGVKFHPV